MKQIIRNKSKLQKRLRSNAFVEPVVDEPVYEEEAVHVAKVKTFPVKPMTEEEAILQMNLLGHTFFMFRNADSGEINVVSGSRLILKSKKGGRYGLSYVVPLFYTIFFIPVYRGTFKKSAYILCKKLV